jgi:hypothetical protein
VHDEYRSYGTAPRASAVVVAHFHGHEAKQERAVIRADLRKLSDQLQQLEAAIASPLRELRGAIEKARKLAGSRVAEDPSEGSPARQV